MDYVGSERRRHRLVLTRNTEYHIRDQVCVAVRDRATKKWCIGHLAVSKKVEGGVRFHDNGAVVPSMDEPAIGEAIFFTYLAPTGEHRQLVTSRIESIGRPTKKDVLTYATLQIKPQTKPQRSN